MPAGLPAEPGPILPAAYRTPTEMSGKLGSEEGLRDPNTPDTLHAQLLAARRERRERRESQSPVLTPHADADAGIANANGAEQSASGQPYFDSEDAEHLLRPPQKDVQPWSELFEFDHPEMMDYMEGLGVKEALELMARIQIDGPKWRMAATNANSTCIKEDIDKVVEAICGKDIPKATAITIVMHTKIAFENWLKKKQETNNNNNRGQQLSIKDLYSIKMPELPAGKGVDGRVTREQVKTYVEALNASLNLIDREYSDRILAIHKQPTASTLAICLEGMTSRAWQLNELVGAAFMKKSSDVSISSITALKRHKHGGRYCGLSILQALGEATTQLTGARLGDLLTKLFKPIIDKPAELKHLEPMYKTHKEALNSLQSLDIELHPVVQCFILQQLASKLAMESEHNIIIGIPMAKVVKKGFEDLTGMTGIVENAIIEASNDPKLNQPRAMPRKEKQDGKQIAAVKPSSVNISVCPYYREEEISGHRCVKTNCRRTHQRSGRTCSAPEYAKYGRCKRYYTDCKDHHPFHDDAKARWSNPKNAWLELCKEFPEVGEAKRLRKLEKKHAYPVCPVCPDARSTTGNNEVITYSPAWASFEGVDTAEGVTPEHTYVMGDSDTESIESERDYTMFLAPDTSDDSYDSDESEEAVEMASDTSPPAMKSSTGEYEYPCAAAMSGKELERFMGREIAPEHTGVVRFEAAIKQIEEREMAKAQLAKEQVTKVLDSETETDEEATGTTEWRHREHYGDFTAGNSIEQAPMQLGSRATKYVQHGDLLNMNEERERCKKFEQTVAEALSVQGGDKMIAAVTSGIPMLMLDSGTYKHIWGTDMVNAGLVYDISALPIPEVVETAAGNITLKQCGKVLLRGIVFTGIVNNMMRLSLLSEGMLYTDEKWKITGEDGVKTCQPPNHFNIKPIKADMCGNLAFWPQEDIRLAIEAVQQGVYTQAGRTEGQVTVNEHNGRAQDEVYSLFTRDEIDTDGGCNLYGEGPTTPALAKSATRANSGKKFDFVENEHGETVLVERDTESDDGEVTINIDGHSETIRATKEAPDRDHDDLQATGQTPNSRRTFSEIQNFENQSNSGKKVNATAKDGNRPEIQIDVKETGSTPLKVSDIDVEKSKEKKTNMPDTDDIRLLDGKLPKDPRTAEYKQHCINGHKPFDPHCRVCAQGNMRAKRATNPKTVGEGRIRTYHQQLETAITDNLMFNDKDVDGNIAASGVYLPRTCFGEVELLKNCTSVAKNRSWQLMQRYIQANTDPGGRLNYRLERAKMDQGSENQGATKEGMAADNVVTDEGHADRHTDQSKVENYFGRVQTTAAIMGVGAFGEKQEYVVPTMGTRVRHAAEMLKHTPCNASQREQDVTPIAEQFHPLCSYEKPAYTYGDMVFAHIEKKVRPNKTGPRAFIAIYAGKCRRVSHNIIVHPIIPTKDREGWEILQSVSVNRYNVVEGHNVLNYPPDYHGQPEIPPELDIVSYDDLQQWAKDQGAWDNTDSENSDLAEGEEEIEEILDHVQIDDDDFDFKVRWKGHDDTFDTWHSMHDLLDCEDLVRKYKERTIKCARPATGDYTEVCMASTPLREIMAIENMGNELVEAIKPGAVCEQFKVCAMLNQGITEIKHVGEWQIDSIIGSDMAYSYPVVEIPVKEFIKMEGGHEAIDKELKAMETRRFNRTKPVPEHIKKTALQCRLICTQKRDGRMKCRLVAKDLKTKRKLPDTKTYAGVPAFYGFRLMLAAADGKVHIVSTTDFDVAYLQTENREDHTTWVLITFKNPITNETEYVWLMGVIYGEQPAGKDWKDSLCHKMVVVGGFQEIQNMANMYYHPVWRVVVGVHVDDPLVVSCDEDGFNLTHNFLDKNFDTKGRSRLTVGSSIDYLSMELTLTESGDITITNRAKCMTILQDAGKEKCTPTTKPPMTKSSLRRALGNQEPLTDEELMDRMAHNGRFNWLAQTTHVGIAVATSIAQGLKPTKGTIAVSDLMYQWVQAHIDDGLISRSGDNSGFNISTDADWAGLYSVTGETRSRTGVMIMYNGMPVLWYTGLQKTISSQWCDDEAQIATSSANAEAIAASETMQRALHVSYIAEEMGMEVSRPIKIEIDANAALGFINNTESSTKMKHLDIRADWIQLIRDRGLADFIKVDGKVIKADFMTKLLNRVEYNRQHKELAYTTIIESADSDSDSDE